MLARNLLCYALWLYWLVLFARVILSWIPGVPQGLAPLVRGIYAITEPVLRPLRQAIPPVRIGAVALDVSILLVFILLGVVRGAVCGGGGF